MAAFAQTRDEIISRALRILGVLEQGETPSSEQVDEAAAVFNAMLETLNKEGVRFWKTELHTLTLDTTGTFLLSQLDADALDILKAYVTNGTTDTEVKVISRYAYDDIIDKTNTGLPSCLTVRMTKDAAAGSCYLYPKPDVATYVLNCETIIRTDSLTDNNSYPDFPPHWLNYLTFQMAYLLSFEYQIPIAERSALLTQVTYEKRTVAKSDKQSGTTRTCVAYY